MLRIAMSHVAWRCRKWGYDVDTRASKDGESSELWATIFSCVQ